jgi:hypothetical protein
MKISCSMVLLLLPMLLADASEAPAASAWVLWVQEERFWDPKGGHWGRQTSGWSVLGASSSETECRRTLRDTVERVTHPDHPRSDADVLYKVTGDTVTFVFYPKDAKETDATMTRSQVLHYVCLPDTVDPRDRNDRK